MPIRSAEASARLDLGPPLLRWHAEIKHRWCYPHRRPGRPPVQQTFRGLALEMARDNPAREYRGIHGELTSLGYTVAPSTIWKILNAVIGHWRTDLPVAGEAGVLPYIYVTSLDDTLRAAAEHGAELVTPPYPEGNLWVATIRDPAGNVFCIRHAGPR